MVRTGEGMLVVWTSEEMKVHVHVGIRAFLALPFGVLLYDENMFRPLIF